ncbi:MAG TPA: DUF2079 domain-containing protein [Candidatus Baltobacteraceae bacterium]|nr:DUF2079 domain-containing protein [Candidatus Baltobacteraceae bacterium]
MRDRFPWVLALLYAGCFTALGAVRYDAHRNLVDFGIFAQTAASAFGCFCNPIEGSHWAFHFSPILYLVGAVLLVWRSPFALIALQSLACALVIPPVYAMVAGRAGRIAARWCAVVVALYPALGGLAFVDFHENAFAPAAIAWGVWSFENGLTAATFFFAILAIAVKEDQAIFMGIAALAGAWRFRGTSAGRTAIGIAAIAAAAVFAFFFWIEPHSIANAHWAPERFYAWTAGDVRALWPQGILQRLGFALLVFAPLAFLPFRSRFLWVALPPFAEVLLSRMSTTFTLGTHYAGAWLGYVLVAFAFAVRHLPQRRALRWLWACAALCALEFTVADPLHPGLNLRAPQPRDAALDTVLASLPPNTSIATQEEAYTHLALRDPSATLLPEDAREPIDACYVLIDRDFPDSPRLQEYGAALQHLVRTHAYTLVKANGGIELYRRSSPSAAATCTGQSSSARTAR